MSEATQTMRRKPPSAEAIAMARAWAARAYADEAEAVLVLELAFEAAMTLAAEEARQEVRP